MNGHDLGNHCPTTAVTSAVLTSNSNCLPQLTLSRPQINALMPNSILLSCGWPVPVRGRLVITTNSHNYKPLFPDPDQSVGHWKPFQEVRERHESTSAAASTLFSDCPELPALTTVFPLVSQDQLGKPQPKGHPLCGRLPFIVWVRLHLPTHYCVSRSSPVPT